MELFRLISLPAVSLDSSRVSFNELFFQSGKKIETKIPAGDEEMEEGETENCSYFFLLLIHSILSSSKMEKSFCSLFVHLIFLLLH